MAQDDPKAELRRTIRAARRDAADAWRAPTGTVEAAWGSALASYVPLAGEPDVGPALRAAAAAGVEVWLPITIAGAPLWWARWRPEDFPLEDPGTGSPLARLLGPRMRAHASVAEVRALAGGVGLLDSAGLAARVDLVLAPALAVDEDGFRLGQGGGYFDRSFGPNGAADLGRVPVWACVSDREILPRGAFPVAPHDLRVQAALTPSGLRTLGAGH